MLSCIFVFYFFQYINLLIYKKSMCNKKLIIELILG